jgi:hypothetical protein
MVSRRPAALLVTGIVFGFAVPAAHGADRIYWSNDGATDAISYANLDGSGSGDDLDTTGATLSDPEGVTIDASAGRIYWVNNGATDSISYANLDGSGAGNDLNTAGATLVNPIGVAIDPAAGRIYWANGNATNPISYARLDGTGGDNLNVTGAAPGAATGVAVDPPTGRIYWGTDNSTDDAISYANLDGSGGGTVYSFLGMTAIDGPYGLAAGPDEGAGARYVYWANTTPDNINVACLCGGFSDEAQTSVNHPRGLALDPETQRLYFVASGGSAFLFRNLYSAPGDLGAIATTGATMSGANFPALLKGAVGAGVPAISGGALTGSALSCSTGSWAADQDGAFFFREPSSFAYQWSRDGADIPGATSSSVVADAPGEYRCRVTAQNAAGSAQQTSAPHKVDASPASSEPTGGPPAGTASPPPNVSVPSNAFAFGKVRLDRKKGTARLPVAVPGAGTVGLAGRGVARVRPARTTGRSTVLLPVKATASARRKLNRTGAVKLRVTVTYAPTGGTARSKSITVKLRKTKKRG